MPFELAFWAPALLAGALAGGSTGLLGVYIVGMRVPFLGVCVSHAALAGAVFGALAGLTGPWLLLPALAGAVLTALLLGMLAPESVGADANVIMSILFSLSMGLAFLGIGLFPRFDRSATEVLGLLWGSLTFCSWGDVWRIGAVCIAELFLIGLFYKELRAVLFSRKHAAAAGVSVGIVWTALLILSSVVLAVNFKTVGGLMIYSLMTNPAAAAFQLTRGYGSALLLATVLGVLSGVGGFLIALLLNLPTGASIVILSSTIVAIAAIIARIRG